MVAGQIIVAFSAEEGLTRVGRSLSLKDEIRGVLYKFASRERIHINLSRMNFTEASSPVSLAYENSPVFLDRSVILGHRTESEARRVSLRIIKEEMKE